MIVWYNQTEAKIAGRPGPSAKVFEDWIGRYRAQLDAAIGELEAFRQSDWPNSFREDRSAQGELMVSFATNRTIAFPATFFAWQAIGGNQARLSRSDGKFDLFPHRSFAPVNSGRIAARFLVCFTLKSSVWRRGLGRGGSEPQAEMLFGSSKEPYARMASWSIA